MTTATDWKPATWTDTGELAVVTDVQALDGAATDNRWLPTVPPEAELHRQHPPLPARSWARILARYATKDRGPVRDVYAHQDIGVDHLHHEAADWKDLAFWAHERQQIPAPQVRDVLTPLVAAYERERDALIRGLPGREYGGYVYSEDRGFEPVQADVAMIETSGHVDRSDVEAMTEGRRRRDTLAAPTATAQQVKAQIANVEAHVDAEPDGWVRSTPLRRALAWIGSRRKRGA